MGVASSDTSKDNRLERIINRVSDWIEHQTGRKFNETMGGLKARRYGSFSAPTQHPTTTVPDEDYVYFSGYTKDRGGDVLTDERGLGVYHLPAYPVQANSVVTFQLAALSERGSTVSGNEAWDTNAHVEWDTFVVERERGVLRLLGGPFAPGYRNYRVTMAAGYAVGGQQPYVPADLEALCIEMCKQMYKDSRNIRIESIGTWSRHFDPQLPDPLLRDILGKYSRFSL